MAGVFVALAAFVDHRTRRIPNRLTLPLILFGVVLLPFRGDIAVAGVTCAVSYALAYGLWRCGLWGGGDAKLVLALFIVASPAYPPLSYIAAFSLCLALVLFAKHFFRPGPGPMGPALLFAYVASFALPDERGVDSLPVALAASLVVLAAIVALAAMGLRGAEPIVSTASADNQLQELSGDCRALLAGSPRDLLDPASTPGSSLKKTLSLPSGTEYVSFGGEGDEGTISYEVYGNKKAIVVDTGVKFREGVKKDHAVVPSRGHRVIEGGGRYELTLEYEYDRGLDERYLVIY